VRAALDDGLTARRYDRQTPITSALTLGGRRLCMTFPAAPPAARGHALVATGGATTSCAEPPR
jgi:hypothetical protein